MTDYITDTAPDAAAPGDEAVLDGTPEVVVETTEHPEPLPQDFAEFGVRQDIVDSLAAEGIVHPFPIQAMTLPVALSGQDIIGQAKTGTGKTLGFGIPVVQRVVGRGDAGWDQLKKPGAPQALIVVPTRELAVQVGHDLATAARTRDARVATIYGGRAYEPQIEQLQAGVEVVVGTPGRLIDLNRQRHLDRGSAHGADAEVDRQRDRERGDGGGRSAAGQARHTSKVRGVCPSAHPVRVTARCRRDVREFVL